MPNNHHEASKSGLSRREVLRRGGQFAAVAGGASLVAPGIASVAATADPVEQAADRADATLVEGTNTAAAVSPDGRWLALDLVTGIWVLPISGGRARRLTDDLTDATQAHWSPDGSRLTFQAYRDGNFHLWMIRADGSGLQQLTSGPFDHREPKFSPDGRLLVFTSDRGNTGSYGVFSYDLGSGAIRALTDTLAEEAMPSWFPGSANKIAFTSNEVAIDAVDLSTGTVERLVTAPADARLYGPSVGPDGRTLAYVRITGATAELLAGERVVSTVGEDVFAFPPTWLSANELLYTADGKIRRRRLDASRVDDIPFTATVTVVTRSGRPQPVRRDSQLTHPRPVKGIASPVCSADGRRIAFRAVNALWLMDIGGRPERIVDDGYFASDPDFSPDGRSLVYVSDRAGDADLWLRDLSTGVERRLTTLPGAQLTPRWSPDGRQIAYQDHDGAAWILDLASGSVRQVTPNLFLPGRPTWSPDGNVLALAAVKPYSARFREGTSQILTVDLRTGTLTYTEPMPHASLTTRGDDGPVWSPDGRHLAFVVGSVAWVVPVDGTGRFTGTPRQVTSEATDSPCWQRNDRLIYLNNGRLRSVPIAGGQARDIPVELSWRLARSTDRHVIHAGAMWDGTATSLRRDVDIVVENGRIAAVLDHVPGRSTVDAARLTVMPGLIDAHNHWHLRGRQWGDRQGRLWLAYGITTTRSPGDPVYQMVETREALESGARIGPRFFATGEAIDGSRVFYNFMRPTRSVAQLGLEMDRARGLEYDMIKTYVRLSVEFQRLVVEQAHRSGMLLSSHYLYPAAAVGMDGMEHFGATNRLGYSHTVSRLGRAYADVIELFAKSGMSLTPTLFNSFVLYAEDRSLVDDRRSRTLFPPWEYERYVARANDATRPPAAVNREMLRFQTEMVLRVHRAGGFVIAGTDSPLDNVAVSLHMNLRAMVRFGFTPHEALVTATANPARWLGLEHELGTIRPGAHADLSFIEGDPLADIRAAAAVRYVMLGGRLHTIDGLMEPFTTPVAAAVATHPSVRRLTTPDRDEWWHRPEWAMQVCCGATGGEAGPAGAH
ncbi:MAG TPA: amidohydrolase family protein [Actinophytocola sp.]|uniref:amidohydrolase family protein n=1 Tax=Actinophytocola sp. TaxID=1872138 RepID=UPI002DB9B880|nr:amidohydrolase family protein [Actinophytocola sp.]HEU5473646.1 amidohydrolase family protein [Actinophytocola sp.]